jgi:hypothetical protein
MSRPFQRLYEACGRVFRPSSCNCRHIIKPTAACFKAENDDGAFCDCRIASSTDRMPLRRNMRQRRPDQANDSRIESGPGVFGERLADSRQALAIDLSRAIVKRNLIRQQRSKLGGLILRHIGGARRGPV